MDPINVLKVFVRLEKDIAAFYGKLKNVSTVREFVDTYEKMERQSSAHAENILKDYKAFRIPDLDISPLIVLHNHVKENLLEEIKNEGDIGFVLEKLAGAEEQLGKIYKSIAIHYKRNAQKFQMLGEAINRIGDEEFQHRDVILKDKMRYEQSKNADESDGSNKKTLSHNNFKKAQGTLLYLKSKLDEINLRENEREIVEKELKEIEQVLANSQDRIKDCFVNVQEVLKHQSVDKELYNLVQRLEEFSGD